MRGVVVRLLLVLKPVLLHSNKLRQASLRLVAPITPYLQLACPARDSDRFPRVRSCGLHILDSSPKLLPGLQVAQSLACPLGPSPNATQSPSSAPFPRVRPLVLERETLSYSKPLRSDGQPGVGVSAPSGLARIPSSICHRYDALLPAQAKLIGGDVGCPRTHFPVKIIPNLDRDNISIHLHLNTSTLPLLRSARPSTPIPADFCLGSDASRRHYVTERRVDLAQGAYTTQQLLVSPE